MNGSLYRYKTFSDWDKDRFLSEIDDIKNNRITLVSPELFNNEDGEVWTKVLIGDNLRQMHFFDNNDFSKRLTLLEITEELK